MEENQRSMGMETRLIGHSIELFFRFVKRLLNEIEKNQIFVKNLV